VRKVGRGKYSEVCALTYHPAPTHTSPALGVRGHRYRERRALRDQGSQAREEEEDQAGDQDPAEPRRRDECRRAARRRARPGVQVPEPGDRVHRERGLQGAVPALRRLRRPLLHARARQGASARVRGRRAGADAR
jgi:hypothetical protein